MTSRAFSRKGSRPARKSPAVVCTMTSDAIPTPSNSAPFGEYSRFALTPIPMPSPSEAPIEIECRNRAPVAEVRGHERVDLRRDPGTLRQRKVLLLRLTERCGSGEEQQDEHCSQHAFLCAATRGWLTQDIRQFGERAEHRVRVEHRVFAADSDEVHF